MLVIGRGERIVERLQSSLQAQLQPTKSRRIPRVSTLSHCRHSPMGALLHAHIVNAVLVCTWCLSGFDSSPPSDLPGFFEPQLYNRRQFKLL